MCGTNLTDSGVFSGTTQSAVTQDGGVLSSNHQKSPIQTEKSFLLAVIIKWALSNGVNLIAVSLLVQKFCEGQIWQMMVYFQISYKLPALKMRLASYH